MENSDIEDTIDGPSFTIGPDEPVPQSAMQERYMSMDKGVPFDEIDYQSQCLYILLGCITYYRHLGLKSLSRCA